MIIIMNVIITFCSLLMFCHWTSLWSWPPQHFHYSKKLFLIENKFTYNWSTFTKFDCKLQWSKSPWKLPWLSVSLGFEMSKRSPSKSIWSLVTYLIFVIFLHEQNFWRIKFTPKKRVNYDKIHRKLPIFCVITAKYTVNCQFFALNL